MNRTPLSIPEIAIISGTRAALGAGVALLLGDMMGQRERRAVGWSLLAFGALTTIPILTQLLSSREATAEEHEQIGDHRRQQINQPDYAR